MGLTQKGLETIKAWSTEFGARQAGFKMVNHNLNKLAMGLDINDLPDTMTLASGLDAIEDLINSGDYKEAWEEAKLTAKQMLEDEGFPGMMENKSSIKETKKMKRVKYKKELPALNEALKLIPNELKIDNEIFEMTDGKKTIKARWEGTLEEGYAVALTAEDKNLVSEDIQKMKALWGYKSEKTTGTPTAENRVTENQVFKELLSTVKKKSINESISILEIANLHEVELLDEGLLSKLGKVAVMLGISLSSFMAMAQENPKQAVNTLQQKAQSLSPEQLADINKATGIDFTMDGANQLFQYDKKDFKAPETPKLDLGKYGDINAVKVVKTQRNNAGGVEYTVQLNKFYSGDYNFSVVRSYIGNQNKEKLKNATIKFVNHQGSPYGGKDITYK